MSDLDDARAARAHLRALNVAEAQAKAVPQPEPTRCRGTRKDGSQCQRFTRRNPSYCWEHR